LIHFDLQTLKIYDYSSFDQIMYKKLTCQMCFSAYIEAKMCQTG